MLDFDRRMDFCDVWDIGGTAEFLLSHGYKRAALQFPDEYLASCKDVASTLQTSCHQLGHQVQVDPPFAAVTARTCLCTCSTVGGHRGICRRNFHLHDHRWPTLQLFILADTSYNSSGVDEVAAEHAEADCVVRNLIRLLRTGSFSMTTHAIVAQIA